MCKCDTVLLQNLCIFQADFIKEAPGNVKDVIRLLKKWKKVCSVCVELCPVTHTRTHTHTHTHTHTQIETEGGGGRDRGREREREGGERERHIHTETERGRTGRG